MAYRKACGARGRVGRQNAVGQGTGHIAHAARAHGGHIGAGRLCRSHHRTGGRRVLGRAQQGDEALEPGRKTGFPAGTPGQVGELQMGMGIDTGRGQAYGPHVPHQRARRQGRGAPVIQGGKKMRAAGRFLPGQGQQAFGADGKRWAVVACILIGRDAIGQGLRW